MDEPLTSMRDAILRSVGTRGVASTKEILADAEAELGGLNPILARQCLGRMMQSHILSKQGHGRYALENGHEYRTAAVSQQMESRIAAVLRSFGGIARTGDIHKALWDRPKGGLDRPYEHRLVTRALAKSPKFHQDFGRGLWNVCEEERLGIPLLGRWAAISLTEECIDADSRSLFFQDVGHTFAIARGDIEVSEITQDSEVRGALQQMGVSGDCRSIALRHLRAEQDTQIALTVQDLAQREEKVCDYLYLLFESGEPSMHVAAPLGLYEGCARLFGVGAPELSRGRLTPIGS